MANTSSLQNIVDQFINQMESQKMIDVSDLPDIDLYMDQVTTFMDNRLEHCKRNPDDKILTKTMINNYAKNHLLPAPHKKKYSKDHMLFLIFIYYFKNILSINDIQKILDPMKENISRQMVSRICPGSTNTSCARNRCRQNVSAKISENLWKNRIRFLKTFRKKIGIISTSYL